MKNHLILFLLTTLSLFASEPNNQNADKALKMRLAVVDMDRVVKEYTMAQDVDRVLSSMLADLRGQIARKHMVKQTMEEKAAVMRESIEWWEKNGDKKSEVSPRYSLAELRQKIQPIMKAIEDLDKELQQLGTATELQKETQQKREIISKMLREGLQEYGARNGYAAIFDRSSTNSLGVNLICVIEGQQLLTDITPEVIKHINQRAAEATKLTDRTNE